jgi:ABC-type glycerol-3-phosphate transport system permease component
MILLYTATNVAFVVWMMKTFIDDIPVEVEEAAILDGCSARDIVFKVTLPMVKGGLGAAGLLVFNFTWSEFLYGLLLTYRNAMTVPVRILSYYSGTHGLLFGPLSALSVIAVVPTVIFGYIIQRFLVVGLTFGAVRGRR